MNYIQSKIIEPIQNQLKKGLDNQSVSKALIAGVIAGIFPIPGLTTGVAVLFIGLLHLNAVITTSINLMLTPLQLALVLPFMRLGDRLLWGSSNSGDQPALSISELASSVFSQPTLLISQMSGAILAWFLLSLVAAIPLHLLVVRILEKFRPSVKQD